LQVAGREWSVPSWQEDTSIDPYHACHQHSRLLRILDSKENWDQVKAGSFLLQKGERQRKIQSWDRDPGKSPQMQISPEGR